MPAYGILYFIAFVAHAVGANCEVTFQTKVLNGLTDIPDVYSCDIVPNGSQVSFSSFVCFEVLLLSTPPPNPKTHKRKKEKKKDTHPELVTQP